MGNDDHIYEIHENGTLIGAFFNCEYYLPSDEEPSGIYADGKHYNGSNKSAPPVGHLRDYGNKIIYLRYSDKKELEVKKYPLHATSELFEPAITLYGYQYAYIQLRENLSCGNPKIPKAMSYLKSEIFRLSKVLIGGGWKIVPLITDDNFLQCVIFDNRGNQISNQRSRMIGERFLNNYHYMEL